MNNSWKIYMLALITFIVATTEFLIAGILDKVAASQQISVSAAGQLITAFAIANAIGSPLVIMAASKLNPRRVMMLSLSILVLGSVLTMIGTGFGLQIVSRIVLAIGSGVFVTVAKTVAAKLAPPDRRAGAIATVITGFSAALIVGVPIGRVVAAVYDWRVIFAGIGTLSLLAIFAVARTIPATHDEVAVPIGKQLALLKNPDIGTTLGVTFFWQLGYAVLFAYISPFLLTVTSMNERVVSIALFAFGLATLIGSKVGGFMTDRIGLPQTLMGSMGVNVAALVLLSTIAHSTGVTVPLLMLWAISAWSSGPVLQFQLVMFAPEASGIMLSLYGSTLQLSIAAAAGIGGIAAGRSLFAVSWTGVASVAAALCLSAGSTWMTRAKAKAKKASA